MNRDDFDIAGVTAYEMFEVFMEGFDREVGLINEDSLNNLKEVFDTVPMELRSLTFGIFLDHIRGEIHLNSDLIEQLQHGWYAETTVH